MYGRPPSTDWPRKSSPKTTRKTSGKANVKKTVVRSRTDARKVALVRVAYALGTAVGRGVVVVIGCAPFRPRGLRRLPLGAVGTR